MAFRGMPKLVNQSRPHNNRAWLAWLLLSGRGGIGRRRWLWLAVVVRYGHTDLRQQYINFFGASPNPSPLWHAGMAVAPVHPPVGAAMAQSVWGIGDVAASWRTRFALP